MNRRSRVSWLAGGALVVLAIGGLVTLLWNVEYYDVAKFVPALSWEEGELDPRTLAFGSMREFIHTNTSSRAVVQSDLTDPLFQRTDLSLGRSTATTQDYVFAHGTPSKEVQARLEELFAHPLSTTACEGFQALRINYVLLSVEDADAARDASSDCVQPVFHSGPLVLYRVGGADAQMNK